MPAAGQIALRLPGVEAFGLSPRPSCVGVHGLERVRGNPYDADEEEAVKKQIAVLVALLFVATPLSQAGAKLYKRHAQRHSSPYIVDKPGYRQTEGWYPHDTNKLPFGSAIWWQQKEREGGALGGGQM